jgi:2'-5' RNA ligase
MTGQTRDANHAEAWVRAFIAVDIGGAVRATLADLQRDLKRSGADVRWTRPESIHLTLAFLGETSAARCAELAGVLDRVALDVARFRFEVKGVGTFGPPRSPRVVWAGVVDESGGLGALHAGVTQALKTLGVPDEKRPFHPHLTLGRVRSRRGVAELTSTVASDNNSPLGWVQVESLLLMRSQLHPQGAQYSALHTSPLKGVEIDGRESL